MEPSLMINLKL